MLFCKGSAALIEIGPCEFATQIYRAASLRAHFRRFCVRQVASCSRGPPLRAHSARSVSMSQRLSILCVSQMPASPPRFGAQARMHGLMTELARYHDLTAVMLVDDEFDIEECCGAMQVYCRDVALVSNPYGRD